MGAGKSKVQSPQSTVHSPKCRGWRIEDGAKAKTRMEDGGWRMAQKQKTGDGIENGRGKTEDGTGLSADGAPPQSGAGIYADSEPLIAANCR